MGLRNYIVPHKNSGISYINFAKTDILKLTASKKPKLCFLLLFCKFVAARFCFLCAFCLVAGVLFCRGCGMLLFDHGCSNKSMEMGELFFFARLCLFFFLCGLENELTLIITSKI